jgi:hypothetical protein
MSLFTYAVRRTMGALVVFLVTVLLLQFAVASIGPFAHRGPERFVRVNEVRDAVAEAWASFPVQSLTLLGLAAAAALAWRLVAHRG